jgi:hypothetical protein
VIVLVDTSVWVEHLWHGSSRLGALLVDQRVLCHPFVVGELALGHLRRRVEVLSLLAELPRAPVAAHDEVLAFADRHGLEGTGVGWVDAHLLCAAALGLARLWSLDRRMVAVAERLGLDA